MEEFSEIVSDCYNTPVMTNNGFTPFDGELDVQVFSRAERDRIVLVFRGTDSITDWITDFQIQQIPLPFAPSHKIRVHYGFYKCYKVVRSFILKEIEHACKPEVVLLSHSLGSGIATIAAYELARLLPDLKIKNITFGSPRVGNREFAKSYNNLSIDTYRFVDPEDVIPTVPLVNYKHVKSLYVCTEDGYIKRKNARRSCFHICCAATVKDHSMMNYHESLSKGPLAREHENT